MEEDNISIEKKDDPIVLTIIHEDNFEDAPTR